jgi:hypothetical protein
VAFGQRGIGGIRRHSRSDASHNRIEELKMKIIMALTVSLAALLAPVAQAQQNVPGEAKAAPSKPATTDEKRAARAARNEAGRDIASKDLGRTDKPTPPPSTSVSKGERASARAQRRSTGKGVARQDLGKTQDFPGGPPGERR